ncbi:MAG TPA: UDP-N-acetylmuramoyl-tripeptide--D-alanyl-D-alanine ligase [Candidatus Nitrosotalea sp.]|nr:UDP-N-acetylmuramoyl-tripeptide--D-alanyl-D-alanine ligase [Candidatus Nitrosotalea sp.]
MKLPLDVAVSATTGRLFDAAGAPQSLRFVTDTRTLEAGDAFVALHGDRFDGHEFAGEAVRRGAALLVIDRPEVRVPGVPAMLVGETNRAYMQLAGAARERFHGRVVAITGSAGKTTTKVFLAQLLAVKYGERVLSAPENENNEIGVSKLLLRAESEMHDVIVAELGARHYGDVAALVAIARPDIGILTNVGDAHVEIMGSRERLEETKWALFGRGAGAVLNAADAASRRRAVTLGSAPHWFAAEASPRDAALDPLTFLDGERRLVHRRGGRCAACEVDVRVPGKHNRANLAAAMSAALELGVSLEAIAAKVSTLRLPAGRYDRIDLASGLHLIYDAYNANASGMIAALDAFAAEAASRRIAVLASMAELGEESEALHERVGEHAAGLVDVLLVSGDYAAQLARGAQRAGLGERQIVFVETNERAARWLREHARPDDVVLLKGSRKYKLEEIVEELRA